MAAIVYQNKTLLVLVASATGAVVPKVLAALSVAGDSTRTLTLDSPESDVRLKTIGTHETQSGDVHENVKGSFSQKKTLED